jgi:hypothetical protein
MYLPACTALRPRKQYLFFTTITALKPLIRFIVVLSVSSIDLHGYIFKQTPTATFQIFAVHRLGLIYCHVWRCALCAVWVPCQNTYQCSNFIHFIETRRRNIRNMRWIENATRRRHVTKNVVCKPEGKKPLAVSTRRWCYSIKIDIK